MHEPATGKVESEKIRIPLGCWGQKRKTKGGLGGKTREAHRAVSREGKSIWQ